MPDNPTFQIPTDVITPIIQAHVSAAVVKALEGRDGLVTKCIEAIMRQKVDEDLKPCEYRGESFLDQAMKKAIREAVLEAIREQMSLRKDAIKNAIAKQFQGKSLGPLALQIVNGMASAITSEETLKYRISVEGVSVN